ncbi:MAG: hypothetical protein K1X79_14170 [Oligoflexia bacterium]|nr:hypothetical protein [Oligoflexia bacterium]
MNAPSKKKEPKDVKKAKGSEVEGLGEITTKEQLKTFLVEVRDRLADQSAAAVYAVTAINHMMSLPSIYSLLDNETKEIARDIWLRIKQSGMQLRNPPLLFQPEEDGLGRNS